MLWVAPWRLFEQVAAAFIRDAGGFSRNETAYRIRISEEDTGLQLLLRQQSSTWLKRQVPSVLYERLVVCRGQPPYGCVTLKRTPEHERTGLDGKSSDELGNIGLAVGPEVARQLEVAPESVRPVTIPGWIPGFGADDEFHREDVRPQQAFW